MPWVEIFAVFIVSHLAGDFLLQTDLQAMHKRGGLSSPSSRPWSGHQVAHTVVDDRWAPETS